MRVIDDEDERPRRKSRSTTKLLLQIRQCRMKVMMMMILLLLMVLVLDTAVAAIPAATSIMTSVGKRTTTICSGGSDDSTSSTSVIIDDASNNGDCNDGSSSHDLPNQSTFIRNQQQHLQDRHVASSPLSVAAVCRDGIALISLHYDMDDILSRLTSSPSNSFSSLLLDPENDGRSSLMQQSDFAKEEEEGEVVEGMVDIEENDDATTASTTVIINNDYKEQQQQQHVHNNNDMEREMDESVEPQRALLLFCDLPLSFRGPLRIETIYENNNYRNQNPRHNHHHHHSSPPSSSSHHRYSSLSPPPISLLTAGWRADSITLANAGRELMAQEVGVYCLPALSASSAFSTFVAASTTNQSAIDESKNENNEKQEEILMGSDGKNRIPTTEQHHERLLRQQLRRRRRQRTQSTYHGRRIAEGLSYYLTKCAAAESGGIGGGSSAAAGASRPLSCVGLLACGDGSSSVVVQDDGRSATGRGALYLIDSTGSYRVRAHAIGDAVRASKLHRRMMHVDFSTMDCHDGLRALLRLIAEIDDEEGGGKGTKEEMIRGEKDKEERTSDNRDNYLPTVLINHESASLPQEDKESNHSGSSATRLSAFVASIGSTSSLMQQQQQQQQQHEQQKSLPSRGLKVSLKYTAAAELAVLRCGEGRMRRVRLSSLFARA